MTEEHLSSDNLTPNRDVAVINTEEHFQRAGEVLAAARKRKGRSLEQVSDQLKISVPYLQALEACHYDQLPGTTFVRGYLRSYARLVELDEDHILGLFGETVEADEQVARLLQEKPLDHHSVLGGRWLVVASSVLLAAFVMGSVVWWNLDHRQDEAPVASHISPVIDTDLPVTELDDNELPVSLDNQDAQDVREDSVVAVQAIGTDKAIEGPVLVALDERLSNQPEPEAVIPEIVESAEALVNDEDRLLVRFSGDCWVEVRDSEGNVLFADLQSGQTELSLAGDGPLSIMFGNVGGVAEVLFNGELVNLDIPVSSRGIGRLTLG